MAYGRREHLRLYQHSSVISTFFGYIYILVPIGRNLTNLEQIEQIKKYPIGLPLFEHESHEWPTDGGFEHLKTRKGRMDSGRKYAKNPISYPKSME